MLKHDSANRRLVQAMKKYIVGIVGYDWAASAHIAAIEAGEVDMSVQEKVTLEMEERHVQ